MMKVYFDTNIYDHIFKRIGLNENNYNLLKNALSSNKITLLLSILNIEETISIFKSSKHYPKDEIKLLIDLTHWQEGIVKPYNDIIKEDLFHYFNGEKIKSYLLNPSLINKNRNFLLNPNENEKIEIQSIITETQNQKMDFYNHFIDFKIQINKLINKLNKNYPTFDNFKTPLITNMTNLILHDFGYNCVSDDEIKNISNIKSIKFYIETTLSLIYSQLFEKRTPKKGDSRDLLHTILATPADIFVTNDNAFFKILKRTDIPEIKFYNLKDFIYDYCK